MRQTYNSTKQFIRIAHEQHTQQLQVQNMRTHYLRVQVEHLFIPANQMPIRFDNVFTGALPDLFIIGLVSEVDTQVNKRETRLIFKMSVWSAWTSSAIACLCHAKTIPRISRTGSIKRTFRQTLRSSSATAAKSVSVLFHFSGPTNTRYTPSRLLTVLSDSAATVCNQSLSTDHCGWRWHLLQHKTKISR